MDMLTTRNIKTNTICRLCTSALTDFSNRFGIYSSADVESNKIVKEEEMNGELLKYSDIIFMITNKFDVTKFSDISDQMCEVCALNLKQFYIFKSKIEKANDIFEDMLENFEKKANIEIDSKYTNVVTEEIIDSYDNQDFPYQKGKPFDNLNTSDDIDIEEAPIEIVYKTGTLVEDKTMLDNLNTSDDIDIQETPSEIVYKTLDKTETLAEDKTIAGNLNTSDDIDIQETPSEVVYKTETLAGDKTILVDKLVVIDKTTAGDKTSNKTKVDLCAVKIPSSRFDTSTKQLPPDEQAKWQKKLEFWIKKQTKIDASYNNNNHTYICENCGKIYRSKYALKQHEYVHTGVMNFECSECGRKFGQKKLLNAHMQIKHIKTKFFTCTKCGRVFNRSSTLAKHRWVHEDVRPFKCEYCEKTFKWKTCYKFHLNTHTKEITYNCYLCDKVYESRASRRKHCLKFHDGLGRAPAEPTPTDLSSSNGVK